MIVLDACVLIAHFDPHDAQHHRAGRLLDSLVGQPKSASVVTMSEILVGPTRAGRRRAAQDLLDRLGIRVQPLPTEAAAQLAELRATTGLKLPDCCVLFTAECNAPAQLATFDERLARIATSRGVLVRTDA